MKGAELLRNLTRSAMPPPQPGPAMLMELERAASQAAGLEATGKEVTFEAEIARDAGLDRLSDTHLLYGLQQQGALVGVVALEPDLSSAIVESQTIGMPLSTPPPERPPSRADGSLCRPFILRLMEVMREGLQGTLAEEFCTGISLGEKLADTRQLYLALQAERLEGLSLSCSYGGRSGAVQLLVSPDPLAPAEPVDEGGRGEWEAKWQAQLNRAPALLEAVLHRMTLPAADVEAWEVGQVVPLPGASVTGLRLESISGHGISLGRLGQIAGFRAVRIELPAAPQMEDTGLSAPPSAPDLPELGDGLTIEAEPVAEADPLAGLGLPDAPVEEDPLAALGLADEPAEDPLAALGLSDAAEEDPLAALGLADDEDPLKALGLD